MILVHPLTWTGWLMGLAAGAAWLVTWYVPIPTWSGGLLGLLTLWGLRLAFFMSHITGKGGRLPDRGESMVAFYNAGLRPPSGASRIVILHTT